MKAKLVALGALLLSTVSTAGAHRVDEYLQATLIAVEKDRIAADMYLTPGVAVLQVMLAEIDTDDDGIISDSEQRAYAARILKDLSLTLNGTRLSPRLVSLEFPPIEEMRAGRGDIHIEFAADLPPTGPNRIFRLENRHQGRISVYQVNSLIPRDPDIRISAEHRNDSQSIYEVDYNQSATSSAARRISSN